MAFLKGFKYALRGILLCIQNERNMRIHTVAAVYVLIFARFFSLTKEDYILLILTICAVISAEMVNTACERLCDLSCDKYSRLVRGIKDIAAGAVLVFAVGAVIIACILFSDLSGYIRIFEHYRDCPWLLIPLGLSIPLSLCYIIIGPVRILKKCGIHNL